ncbi:MAG: L,D-transpeptidase family protein [Pseudomonadota bacterium]
MTNPTWFSDDEAFVETQDRTEVSESLWTRRSALALTAGFLASGATFADAKPFAQVAQPRANHIVVSKRNRVMALMAGEQTLKRYRIHLGFAPEGHKGRSGDGRTPEGRYYINRRNPRSDFHLSLGISYPNAQDIARALSMGVDPGGDIFIHGGPRRRSDRNKKDWTAGCIAVSDREMEEIWAITPTGIPVTILS